ncbi:hypothetical protein [Microtetraspora sp. NBRC 16547]|uniref:hypothetical protein n=1 Tax=Microtetraspora sp. NBRC 16547 TaxID=3030993 RepID=UPI0024A0B9E8|nr:hypothetical protein [Microtetraspora sp. NBRC 16547]GLX00351.1 hypothetical protein Misp02_44370 [Microtetraspora sp. NBRC 16547]
MVDNDGRESMSAPEYREQLERVDADLARLRQEVRDMRREIGERGAGPTDAAEMSSLITNAEQQEALIEDLELRRQQLLRRLEEA